MITPSGQALIRKRECNEPNAILLRCARACSAQVRSCVNTKFISRFGDIMVDLAIDAVMTVVVEIPGRPKEVDIKRYAKVEKVGAPRIRAPRRRL